MKPSLSRLVPLPLAAALALAACGEEAEVAGGEGQASGEVLEGSISDAMLPLDQLTSSAPIATPSPTQGAAAADGDAEADADDGDTAGEDDGDTASAPEGGAAPAAAAEPAEAPAN